MGRTLKRVPLDFAWPLKETWSGYINPHASVSHDCPTCAGSGLSAEAKRIQDQWYGNAPFDPAGYGAAPLTVHHPSIVGFAESQCRRHPEYYGKGIDAVANRCFQLWDLFRGQWCHHLIQADVDALVAEGRLMDFTHVARTPEQVETVKAKLAAGGNSWLPEPNGYKPTADEVNSWSIGGLGHDAINSWVCVRARCEREGIVSPCSVCNGDGEFWPSHEAKASYQSWEETEPPTGEGFQLWETVSEGSPISPVFASVETLCEWCANNATSFGSYKATAEKWREMLDANFVHHTEGNAVFL